MNPTAAAAADATNDNPFSNFSMPPRDGITHWEVVNRTALANLSAATAAYGHRGREPKTVEKIFNKGTKNEKKVKVELFPWEKLDYVDQLKKVFKV